MILSKKLMLVTINKYETYLKKYLSNNIYTIDGQN